MIRKGLRDYEPREFNNRRLDGGLAKMMQAHGRSNFGRGFFATFFKTFEEDIAA